MQTDQRLKGRNIVITGASSGLGERIALQVAACGGNPILLARRQQRLLEVKAEIDKSYPVSCSIYALDLSRLAEIEDVFSQILREQQTIDVLVNNAGFGVFKNFIDTSWEEMESIFTVNVFGLMACTKMVLPHMVEKNGGHIILIGSQAGKLATPKSSLYAASKHAVLGFADSLRMELVQSNVVVTTVNPGPIQTDFFVTADPSGQYAKKIERYLLDPERVAAKIVRSMMHPIREINLPWWMNMGSKLHQLFPHLVEKIGGKAFYQK